MTNKPSSGGGDNKIHQIIMAVITTIAAPVIVFMVTNNFKNNPSPTPVATVLVQVVTATSPANTLVDAVSAAVKPAATATAPNSGTPNNGATPNFGAATLAPTPIQPTLTHTPASQPTQAAITSPSGTIKAGTPVPVDGLVLTVGAQDVKADGKTIRVSVRVKNTSSEKRTLSFTPASIGLKDDTRHTYEIFYGDKKTACKKDALSRAHTLELEPQQEVILTSVSTTNTAGWCVEKPASAIPLFTGPVGKNAKKLEVLINGVGPFKGFQVEVELSQ